MVRAGLLKDSLKVVCRQPRLALAFARGSCDILLVGTICFIVVIVVVVGRGCNPLWETLFHLLAALGILLGILGSDVE
jgi:hypothetical protein